MLTRTIAFRPTACTDPCDRDRSRLAFDARSFGMLEAELRQLRRELGALKLSVAEITRARQEARGGWRVAAFAVPLISALCAAVTLLLRLHAWR